MEPGVIRNDERTRREERAVSMIAPKSEEHGVLKIKSGVCRLKSVNF